MIFNLIDFCNLFTLKCPLFSLSLFFVEKAVNIEKKDLLSRSMFFLLTRLPVTTINSKKMEWSVGLGIRVSGLA